MRFKQVHTGSRPEKRRQNSRRDTDGTTSVTTSVTSTLLFHKQLLLKAGHGCHHQWHHPFLLYIINKDIIKGSFVRNFGGGIERRKALTFFKPAASTEFRTRIPAEFVQKILVFVQKPENRPVVFRKTRFQFPPRAVRSPKESRPNTRKTARFFVSLQR